MSVPNNISDWHLNPDPEKVSPISFDIMDLSINFILHPEL
jgi:hypothetical protein